MPFFRLTAPSISLATLQAALERDQVPCELEHLNLEFVRRIGKERYGWIACASPTFLLAGDLVFAPSLYQRPFGRDQLAELVASLGTRAEGEVPDWFVSDFPELAAAAETFLDEQVRSIPWQDYDLVGFSTIFHVTPALALARRIKERERAPAIVLGGSNCEGAMGEQLHRAFPFIDFVCRGEGETLLLELARSVAAGRTGVVAAGRTGAIAAGIAGEEGVPGLVWREGAETRLDPRRGSATSPVDPRRGSATSPVPTPFPLDALPVPDYGRWLQQVRSTGMLDDSELQLPIETSRGCWYGERRTCLFCGLNGQGISYRRKSAARILDELRGVMDHGVKVLHCVDNILDPHYFDDLLPALAERRAGCEIFWPVRPDLGRDQLATLQASGVCWVQVGIESLSTAVLRLMGKGTTALQNVRWLRHAAEVGLGAAWNVLFGFPGEAPEAYHQMAALMPALAHLQPPRMSHQIRMERFAPLYDRRRGVKGVVPARAYQVVYPFEPRIVEQLAYYFEYEYTDQPDPFSYVGGCLEAMASWRREVGQAALIGVDTGSSLHVRDSRRIAGQRHTVLRGLERDVLREAAEGLDAEALGARTGAAPDRLEAALRDLQHRRWLEHLDGKYLSLIVPVDRWVPPGVPPAMVCDALEERYRRAMTVLHDGSSGLKRLTATEPGGAP